MVAAKPGMIGLRSPSTGRTPASYRRELLGLPAEPEEEQDGDEGWVAG